MPEQLCHVIKTVGKPPFDGVRKCVERGRNRHAIRHGIGVFRVGKRRFGVKILPADALLASVFSGEHRNAGDLAAGAGGRADQNQRQGREQKVIVINPLGGKRFVRRVNGNRLGGIQRGTAADAQNEINLKIPCELPRAVTVSRQGVGFYFVKYRVFYALFGKRRQNVGLCTAFVCGRAAGHKQTLFAVSCKNRRIFADDAVAADDFDGHIKTKIHKLSPLLVL